VGKVGSKGVAGGCDWAGRLVKGAVFALF